MKTYIMALDQGTTSSRCVLYDHDGRPVSMAQKEYRQYFPHEGWVEQDAMEIWSSQLSVIQEALARVNLTVTQIEAIGITNQRETTIVWDRETGIPVCHAIVWQCRRTAAECDRLEQMGLGEMLREKTGLRPDAYFSATKLQWILDHIPDARTRAEQGELLFGTVDTWLIWKLTGGAVHVTDRSNASRTMLLNLHTASWDPELLHLFDIPAAMMPEVKSSCGYLGSTDPKITGTGIPITGCAGDQQAALFGTTCFAPGQGKMTFGTGGFLLMNTGNRMLLSRHGLLTTIAWERQHHLTYALEGSVFVSGAVIQWLRDELHLIHTAAETAGMAESLPDNGGVYIVPAFTGLGAPYWDPYSRGTILGLTRGTTPEQIVRAALECQAFQTMDLLQAMTEELHESVSMLHVDGGGCRNDFIMQFLADLCAFPVYRSAITETTSLGAAYLAGLASGYWKNCEELECQNEDGDVFVPLMPECERHRLLDRWHEAVHVAQAFSQGGCSVRKK